jgi:uncharacterized RDD family membrane protein YckC
MSTVKLTFKSSQHVLIDFEAASVFQRIGAYILDTIILSVYLFIAMMSIQFDDLFTDFGTWMFMTLLLIKLPWILYQPVMEYITGGQTIGKMVVGIRVLKITGDRVGFKEVMTRWFFRGDFLWVSANFFILFIPLLSIIDAFICGLSIDNQRIGDSLGGTIVIKTKSTQSYSLKDVLKIQTNENFTPTYPQVIRFTDEDMIYIKNCIQQLKRNKNKELEALVVKIANESARLMNLEQTPKEPTKFLETLLNEYVVLTR